MHINLEIATFCLSIVNSASIIALAIKRKLDNTEAAQVIAYEESKPTLAEAVTPKSIVCAKCHRIVARFNADGLCANCEAGNL